ncbi:MAG: hypothetical protein Q9202_006245 [Teloschistes flavicans]
MSLAPELSSLLTREYATITANPPPYITAHPSESNILEWHYILTGPPETPYHNGQYWGTLLFPPNYPFAPPSIRMHTPSGRFQPSTRLCLSISDFHPKSFNPAWEVSTILIGLMSFMTSDEITTGSIRASENERRYLAARTRWWNSTGGGSRKARDAKGAEGANKGVVATAKGIGAVKAGDGGVKFRTEWPELDEENWKWLADMRIDTATGGLLPREGEEGGAGVACSKEVVALARGPNGSGGGLGAVMGGGQALQDAGNGWLRRHRVLVFGMVVVGIVMLNRLFGEGGR